ncbi:Hint domain-containing protein [Yoonia litorea]|uniref:Hint domain-containing protein n=1 Tax=Yoonia litorea TaxID=1123755 RepID=A0A1I6M4V2_9RHOB|nr:Hint domain-containing protein [Yoonia litorea]SFS10745.1 Hint domain-containing protein [Yoonia litorea]
MTLNSENIDAHASNVSDLHDGHTCESEDADLRHLGISDLAFAASGNIAEVHLFDGTVLPITQIDQLIPCFTPGTKIATPKGEVSVERLKVGDRVLTRDNGIRTINWVGHKKLDHLQLKMLKQLRPVLIKAGALGDGKPERDMSVSPMHRMLVVSKLAQKYFDQSEVLVPAKELLQLDGVELADVPYVTYVHFLCDNHEIVLSDGAWSESFQPGDISLKGLDDAQREELFALFPDLKSHEGVKTYRAARRSLSSGEATLLFSG